MLKSIAICTALALAIPVAATAQDVSQSGDALAAAGTPGEVPQAVKNACKDDYEKHCSAHDPESASARDCMADKFAKLSDPCVTAILDSPLVEQAEQQMADAPPSHENGGGEHPSKAAKHDEQSLPGKASHKAYAAKPARKIRTADARPPANAGKARQAHRESGSRRSVSDHIRRGTGIANYYVAKYTRFAFAKAFR